MSFVERFYTFECQLSDVERGKFCAFRRKIPKHEAESWEFFYARVLALCLTYEDDAEFSADVLSNDQPVVCRRSVTGEVLYWGDVGLPDTKLFLRRLKSADSNSRGVFFYSNEQVQKFCQQMRGVKVTWEESASFYQLLEIVKQLVDSEAIDSPWSVTIVDSELFIEFGTASFRYAVQRLDMKKLYQESIVVESAR